MERNPQIMDGRDTSGELTRSPELDGFRERHRALVNGTFFSEPKTLKDLTFGFTTDCPRAPE